MHKLTYACIHTHTHTVGDLDALMHPTYARCLIYLYIYVCLYVLQVIPTYYATFTLSCIIAAAVVYREFEGLSFGKIMLFFIGLVTYTFAKTKKKFV